MVQTTRKVIYHDYEELQVFTYTRPEQRNIAECHKVDTDSAEP